MRLLEWQHQRRAQTPSRQPRPRPTRRRQRRAEQSENLDELLEVAEKASGAKLAVSQRALGVFLREKARTLKLVEEKFNGKVGRG